MYFVSTRDDWSTRKPLPRTRHGCCVSLGESDSSIVFRLNALALRCALQCLDWNVSSAIRVCRRCEGVEESRLCLNRTRHARRTNGTRQPHARKQTVCNAALCSRILLRSTRCFSSRYVSRRKNDCVRYEWGKNHEHRRRAICIDEGTSQSKHHDYSSDSCVCMIDSAR